MKRNGARGILAVAGGMAVVLFLFFLLYKETGRRNGDNEAWIKPEETKKWLILKLECEIPQEFLKEVRGRVVKEQKTGDSFQMNMEERRLVLCGRRAAEEGAVDGLVSQMLSVCDGLTRIRSVQAMIFPEKTALSGKGSGLPKLTVTESRNGFRVNVEKTMEEAEKALEQWLKNGEIRDTENIVAGVEETGADRKRKPPYAKVEEEYIYIKISAITEVMKPKLTTKQAKKCNTLLASYTTYFETAGSGRARNIAVGAAHLNGRIVYPGEEFSTAAALMPFSVENGYVEGGTFIGGEVSESIGGGVCQISSTLYNALLQTKLPVTKRYAHSMPVAYVPLGRDAAIAGDYKDLRFKNTTKVPVLLLCTVTGKKVTVSLYGVAEAKKEGVRLRQVTTKETAEEVWVETYREYPDADGRLLTEKVAESRYRYPR